MATGWGREVRRDFQRLATQVATTKTYTTPFASLSTANPNDDGQSNAEPTATNGYAAQAISWTAPPLPTNDAAAIAANSAAISWTSSGGAFSTGATNLTHVGIWNHVTTRTEAAFLGRAAIAVPQAVNAAGITLTIAIGALSMGCISA
jgi:hypothetical protein